MMRGLLAALIALVFASSFEATGARAAEIAALGLDVVTVTPTTRLPKGLRTGEGALVLSVQAGGPAATAGLKPGDVIILAGGEKIKSAEQLAAVASRFGAGQTLSLTRVRSGAMPATVAILFPGAPDVPVPPPVAEVPMKPAPSGSGGMGGPSEPRAGGNDGMGVPPFAGTPPPAGGGMGAPAPRRYYRTVEPSYEPEGSGAPLDDGPVVGSPSPEEPVVGSPAPGEPEVGAPEEPVAEAPPRTRGLSDPGEAAGYTVVRVFYATDRNRTQSSDPASFYGGDRSTLQYGTCEVTVPKDHRVGELESPSYLRLEFSEDPKKHVILSKITEQNVEAFYDDLQDHITESRGRSAFIFVHGYNVTFKDAARRTAQMAYDLKFDGAPVFFSWPSQGSLVGYTIDEANIEYARSDLKAFIAEFARTSKAEQIYLVAHSMGNRALTGAVADLFRDAPDVKAKIKEIILAAPDVDAAVFKRDIAPMIAGKGQAVTLYASSNDWALKASKKFHGYPRAGDSGPSLTVVPGVATIDSSEVETDFLGHSYFAESTSIIADIFGILAGRTKPEDRKNLIPIEAGAGRYWKFPKVTPGRGVP